MQTKFVNNSCVIFLPSFAAAMAIKITDDCINCGACEPECPNNAIYEGGVEWAFADGTNLKGAVTRMDGVTVYDADQRNAPIATDIYYIVPDKCTECQGFHEEPQCAAVCPVDCCIPDELYRETVEELLAKKEKMHG
ncbi:MAG TPA: 4Fe-4S dicluster domain-containing protein [Ginsengibacter sp.]|nr:4Fe-4S dicluster domain-containing protein [Ginsengibacter sp.]